MTDLDTALQLLGATDHPRLAAIDDRVLARIDQRNQVDGMIGAPLVAMAMLGAITFGFMASALHSAPAEAAALSPFAAVSPLAPSTLLAADR